MANIITGKTRDKARRGSDFLRDHDKGSRKPAFCYPRNVEDLKTEVERTQKFLERYGDRDIAPERRAALQTDLTKKKARLDAIQAQTKEAKQEFKSDPDYWNNYRKELAQNISENTPSRTDVKDRRVNAWQVNKVEKGVKGKKTVNGMLMSNEEMKTEYQIISRLMDEDSDVGHLQRN